MRSVNCDECGTAYAVEPDPADPFGPVIVEGPVPVEVETADDGSGWFLTCPPNRSHADPVRVPVTREDVS